MMKPGLKAAWVAALRSDEFFQTSDVLCSIDNRHCCLGVLCEIDGREKVAAAEERHFIDPDGLRMTYIPSHTMCEEWGVLLMQFSPYWNMNDRGASFFEIADAIEKDISL